MTRLVPSSMMSVGQSLFSHNVLSLLLAVSTSTIAASGPVDFIRDVQPIFQRHCYACHGPEKQKSEFRLDVRDVAFKGGELYAPNITPGQAAESTLLQFVSGEGDLEMPPEGPRLSPEEIATLRAWIDQGAPWPDDVAG